MKNYLCCILLMVELFVSILGSNDEDGVLVGIPYASDNDNNRDKIGDFLLNKKLESNFDYNKDLGIFQKSSSYKFAFDDGNPDVHGNIKRPCQAYDTFCIRKFFAEHSKCKISGIQVPDPVYRAQTMVTYPSANMSAIANNAIYTGVNNARVQEFYIDTVTDNLVIAFAFDTITQTSNFINLKFYLRGREPEVHLGSGTQAYVQITVTMVIPGLQNLTLDRAEITTYADNPVLPFAVSPTLALSTNPEVLAMTSYFLTAGIQNEHLEELSTEGVFFAGNYLQYNICDFGLKLL